MRLEYFQRHRTCFYLAVCSCSPRLTRYYPSAPFAATRHAANHARRHPGHTAYVFDMTHLETVSVHTFVGMPLDLQDRPPF
jgi:hypothetical protein